MADKKQIIFSAIFLSVFFVFSSVFCQDIKLNPSAELTLTSAISIAFQNNKDVQMPKDKGIPCWDCCKMPFSVILSEAKDLIIDGILRPSASE